MDAFLNYLKSNWDFLVILLVAIANIIIGLFRKKVKVSDVFSGLLMELPSYINVAEGQALSGEAKYTAVLSMCIRYLMSVTGLSSEECTEKYSVLIDTAIESILSTPQKKGK